MQSQVISWNTCKKTVIVSSNVWSPSEHLIEMSKIEWSINQEIYLIHYFSKRCVCLLQFSSVTQSCSTLCDPMNRSTPGLPVHHQLPEYTQTQRPLSQWCHPAISSSLVPFSSCPQSLPVSESLPMSQLFAWGGQSTGASALASFLPKKSQGWSPSKRTRSCSPRDSQESSPTPQLKSINSLVLSFLHSPTHIHTWPLEKPYPWLDGP